MKIRYSKHGLERLIQRNIPKELIEEAIKLGHKTELELGKIKVRLKKRNKTLIVIYLPSVKFIKIITAYYL